MFGFIVLRHVNSTKTNLLWLEAVRCIRKLYSNPILVIDDNSNYELVSNTAFPNMTIVQSEFPRRGELLPYYYFYKLKPFDKAVIIHDGVFIQKFIDFDTIKNVKFIWHFEHHCDNDIYEKDIIRYLKNSQTLIDLYDRKDAWVGCFGGMSCISLDFLTKIMELYDMTVLLDHIKDREQRMCFERILAVICVSLNPDTTSIFGNIHHSMEWGYTFERYINEDLDKEIVKVWSGR